MSKGLVPELSLVFWATGPICGQASLSTADRSPDPAFELDGAVFCRGCRIIPALIRSPSESLHR